MSDHQHEKRLFFTGWSGVIPANLKFLTEEDGRGLKMFGQSRPFSYSPRSVKLSFAGTLVSLVKFWSIDLRSLHILSHPFMMEHHFVVATQWFVLEITALVMMMMLFIDM